MKRPPVLLATLALAAVMSTVAVGGPSADAAPVPDPVSNAIVQNALTALRANADELGFSGDGRGALGLGERNGVKVVDVVADPNGATHVRMDRTFAGLPVVGGDFVVHRSAAGAWEPASATFTAALDGLNLTPGLDAAGAISRLALGTDALRATLTGTPRLVIDTVGGPVALAWEVPTAGTRPDGTPSRLLTYVDAASGAVRWADDSIHTVEGPNHTAEGVGEAAEGEGRSLYLGTVPLRTSLLDGLFTLKDLSRGGGFTADAQNRADNCLPIGLSLCTSNAPADQFTDDDNRWGNGSELNRQSAAVDAQYGSDVTWDYFKAVHKRSGVGNDGVGVYSRVHYGEDYANAFWSDECLCMTFGDGDRKTLGPLVSLDITGHEITHGVTTRTARLNNSGEAGGLNEATSDIFGTMIEFYSKNEDDKPDYLVGETVFLDKQDKDGQPNAIRYMWEPSLDKQSPDCYHSAVDQLDVHLSAGPANHFFYLLAEGSERKTIAGIEYASPTCDGKKVAGIGRDAAAKIWYRALTMYFTSNMTYPDAREAVLRAAKDLHGDKSTELAVTEAAWSAVNVTAQTDPDDGLL
ncbi:MAG: M4 family metallopeptidase [Sporichthyaceae bacterium]